MPSRPQALSTVAGVAVAVVLVGSVASARASGCPRNLAEALSSTGAASQLITVQASGSRSRVASLRLWRRQHACWLPASPTWPARLGYAGLSSHHREGDGTTPAGAFSLGTTVYGVGPDPGTRYRYHRLVCGDWWDEDPASPDYNSFQHVPCAVRPPFGGASEALWTETAAYQHFLVVDYNIRPRIPGRGSGIFIHDDLGHPTNGCVSLPPPDLDALLRWLRPADSPLIVIGTDTDIRAF